MLAPSIAVLAVIAAAAVAEPELGRPFDVKPAEVVTIQGLRITFEGIAADSRCPTGAECMWAGDAVATFTLEKPPSAAQHRPLHTSDRFDRQADVDAFVVRLEDVKPYPKEGAAISADDYRVTLIVRRR
jgi:hypothetical protein